MDGRELLREGGGQRERDLGIICPSSVCDGD